MAVLFSICYVMTGSLARRDGGDWRTILQGWRLSQWHQNTRRDGGGAGYNSRKARRVDPRAQG